LPTATGASMAPKGRAAEASIVPWAK